MERLRDKNEQDVEAGHRLSWSGCLMTDASGFLVTSMLNLFVISSTLRLSVDPDRHPIQLRLTAINNLRKEATEEMSTKCLTPQV